jgi:hypothetical protein
MSTKTIDIIRALPDLSKIDGSHRQKIDSSKHFVYVQFKATARADDAVLVMDD